MSKILATTSSFGTVCPDVLPRLQDAGYVVEVNPFGRKLTEAELSSLLAEHKPVGLLAGTEPVTGAILTEAAPYLRIVSRIGVGWDNVDHDVAGELGIPVFRTEGVLEQSVAELTLGMMLNALRHISRHDREMRSGTWKKHMGSLLSAKTVGVVGYGAIGRRVAELCRSFGASIVFCDVRQCCGVGGDKQVSMEDLLKQADIVSVHASGSGCLIDAGMLALCKPTAILVNTARGGLIDEAALALGIREGRLGCACLDVFDKEPYTGELLELDNAILTSHIGSYASEARIEMERMAVENLLNGLAQL